MREVKSDDIWDDLKTIIFSEFVCTLVSFAKARRFDRDLVEK